MLQKELSFSDSAPDGIESMRNKVTNMLYIAKEAFETHDKEQLPAVATLENEVDEMKRQFTASHFSRLSEGSCLPDVSPYYTSTVAGLERVADHIVNIGYRIQNPIGSQKNYE